MFFVSLLFLVSVCLLILVLSVSPWFFNCLSLVFDCLSLVIVSLLLFFFLSLVLGFCLSLLRFCLSVVLRIVPSMYDVFLCDSVFVFVGRSVFICCCVLFVSHSVRLCVPSRLTGFPPPPPLSHWARSDSSKISTAKRFKRKWTNSDPSYAPPTLGKKPNDENTTPASATSWKKTRRSP